MKKLSAIESMFITLNLYPARGFNNPGIRYRIYLLLCLLLVVNACGAENPSVTADVASSVENVKLSDSKSISQDKLQTIADTVYLGGRIYTVDANDSWAQALAIANGKILAVGSDELIRSHISGTTQVVNLDNMMVMPGIHDMHVHPMEAGQKALYQCGFPFTMTLEEIFEKLSECVSETPKGEWILGGQWASQLLESDPVPHKSMLDAVTQDHPVYLGDSTVHSAWLNSRALDLLGIDENTPETKGGVIVREQDTNEPTGILLDKAAYKVLQEIPPYTETEYEDALKWAIGEMNRFGVTTIKVHWSIAML
jgi:predicted amidohydrolase YtcJ